MATTTLSLYDLNNSISAKATTAVATSSVSGLMSTADKTKLDGITANANNYVLPQATVSSIGGVKIGAGINLTSDGTISVNQVNAYVLPAATVSTLGGVKIGANITIAADGTISASPSNNYVLPIASSTSIGGIKAGANMSIDSNGVITANISAATSSIAGLMAAGDKSKLDGLASSATAVTSSITNGNIRINGTENIIYTHPATHPASVIVQDNNNKFVTQTQITQWNNATPLGHTHSGTDITSVVATSTTTKNIPTTDVGGNVWISTTTTGIEGLTTAIGFGSSTAPVNPATNQLWFDVSNRLIKFWDGSSWQPFGSIYL